MNHFITVNPIFQNYTVSKNGDHDYINIPMNKFLQLDPIPVNRDSENRIGKMMKTFSTVYAKNKLHTMTEFALGIVVKDFIDPETMYQYKIGNLYIIDGNTRQHFWKTNPDKAMLHTNGLTGRIHYLSSIEDVEFSYKMYNNAKSAETISEQLQGLLRRFKFEPNSGTLRKGNFSQALAWASMVPKTSTKTFLEQFQMNLEGIKITDSIPSSGVNSIWNPTMKGISASPIHAAILLAIRLNPNNANLYLLINKLATVTANDLKFAIAADKVDAADIIALEYNKLSHMRAKNGNAEPWLKNMAGLTTYESRIPQMDFLMYYIGQYMDDPNKQWSLRFGISSDRWEKAYENFFTAYNGTLHPSFKFDDYSLMEKTLNLKPNSLAATVLTNKPSFQH
jgi:hypothetical protein